MSESRPDRSADDVVHAALARARELAATDAPRALRVLDDEQARCAHHGLYHHARGALRMRVGRVDDAIASFEEAVRLLPDVPDVAGNLGAALLHKARGATFVDAKPLVERARDVLARAAADRPRTPEVRANLAFALELCGDAAAAVRVCEDNLQLFPDDVPTLFNQASAHNALGHFDRARTALQRVLAIRPDFAAARDALARLPMTT